MVETVRHHEAFDYYYTLGNDRNNTTVSVQFEVSKRSVDEWSRQFNWQERVVQRDIEISRKLEIKTNEAIVREKANYRKIISASVLKYVQNLRNGVIEIKTPKDLETLIKLDLLLVGEATDASEIRFTHEDREFILRRMASIAARADQSRDIIGNDEYTGESKKPPV